MPHYVGSAAFLHRFLSALLVLELNENKTLASPFLYYLKNDNNITYRVNLLLHFNDIAVFLQVVF